MKVSIRGFSLIEVVVTVAIIGILTAIALPSYNDYIMRSRLTDAYSGLGGTHSQAQQHWDNNRTFEGLEARLPAATENFTFTVSDTTVGSYVLSAVGHGKAAGFIFTIDESGARATPSAPDGWATSGTCWINSKAGKCIE